MEREAAIELGTRVVENLAKRLLWRGQKTFIEYDDLKSVGIPEMFRTIDREAPASGFPLDKRIARNVKTIMLRFVQDEAREFRYRQLGAQKAIRDTDQGNQAGDVDGEDGATARIPPSVKNRDFPNSDAFVYRTWLRGAVTILREPIDGGPALVLRVQRARPAGILRRLRANAETTVGGSTPTRNAAEGMARLVSAHVSAAPSI